MRNFFYNFCSIGIYPFTPTYTRIFTAYDRDASRKAERVIYLLMSNVNNAICQQILVKILYAVLELLHACEGWRYATRSAGLIT